MDRTPHDRRPLSRPPRLLVRRCRSYLGAVWRLRDERGNRRRHEFVLDVGGRNQGLGEPAILDAYEIERQPVTEQVSRYAMNTFPAREALRNGPGKLEEPGPEGDAIRARIGKNAYELNIGHSAAGAQLRLFLQGLADHRL